MQCTLKGRAIMLSFLPFIVTIRVYAIEKLYAYAEMKVLLKIFKKRCTEGLLRSNQSMVVCAT